MGQTHWKLVLLLIEVEEELATFSCHFLNCSNFFHNSSPGIAVLFILETFWFISSGAFAVLGESWSTENTEIPSGRFWIVWSPIVGVLGSSD